MNGNTDVITCLDDRVERRGDDHSRYNCTNGKDPVKLVFTLRGNEDRKH